MKWNKIGKDRLGYFEKVLFAIEIEDENYDVFFGTIGLDGKIHVCNDNSVRELTEDYYWMKIDTPDCEIEKIPIDEYGNGNCCPECGSMEITIHQNRSLRVDVNMSTNEIFIMKNGEITSPIREDKVRAYDEAVHLEEYCECRECGWTTKSYVPIRKKGFTIDLENQLNFE